MPRGETPQLSLWRACAVRVLVPSSNGYNAPFSETAGTVREPPLSAAVACCSLPRHGHLSSKKCKAKEKQTPKSRFSLAPEPVIAAKQPIGTRKACASGIAETVTREVINRQFGNVSLCHGFCLARLSGSLERLSDLRGFRRNRFKKRVKTVFRRDKNYAVRPHKALEGAARYARIRRRAGDGAGPGQSVLGTEFR